MKKHPCEHPKAPNVTFRDLELEPPISFYTHIWKWWHLLTITPLLSFPPYVLILMVVSWPPKLET